MACEEVARLRELMKDLRRKLKEQRAKARSFVKDPRPGRFVTGRSDYEPLLQRRIQMLSVEIERHVTSHRCQE